MGRESLLFSIAVALPVLVGIGFTASLSFLKKKNTDRKTCIRDPEFSGFCLVQCRPPYVSDTSENTTARNQTFLIPSELASNADNARRLLDGRLHPVDVIVASYPKSGTTLLSELVFLLVNNLDWSQSAAQNLEIRVPYFEYLWPGPHALINQSAPRIVKTHLPFTHLPRNVQCGESARIIYIVRDPRDVVVSYHHFTRCFIPAGYKNQEALHGFVGRFLADRLPYSPWTEHVKSYLMAAASNHSAKQVISPKILIVQFEDLKCNLRTIIREIESFLHRTWPQSSDYPVPQKISDEELEQLVEHCSFQAMSTNPTTNFSWWKELGLWNPDEKFMRRGVIGDHQYILTANQSNLIREMAVSANLEWTLADNFTQNPTCKNNR
ncbi:hypothetical protein EG68_10929 [Paragonimus skrjabini miyazakii]|uniref:Sulfotransferase domain-containing protein n=1 Tax=Paragonimus skrjabini miyazakii TaxID=59628 RepID=A0A8S9YH93_9TREM|nr:hypothetical protein EG68_10929 [Paragonimus skrjabini miyazakii]